jgi:hypothetical protein
MQASAQATKFECGHERDVMAWAYQPHALVALGVLPTDRAATEHGHVSLAPRSGDQFPLPFPRSATQRSSTFVQQLRHGRDHLVDHDTAGLQPPGPFG